MAILTVCNELELMEAGNSVLMSSVFHRFEVSREFFFLCACVLDVTRHSLLFTASTEIRHLKSRWRMVIVSAQFGGKQSHETGPIFNKKIYVLTHMLIPYKDVHLVP